MKRGGPYMGGIERGERNIAAINIIRIAKTLKVEVGEIFPYIRNLRLKINQIYF